MNTMLYWLGELAEYARIVSLIGALWFTAWCILQPGWRPMAAAVACLTLSVAFDFIPKG